MDNQKFELVDFYWENSMQSLVPKLSLLYIELYMR